MPSQFRAGGPKAPKTILRDGREISYSCPLLMGIINVTPDSFFGGSRRSGAQEAAAAAVKMSEAGARVIDIGGESTRPGAEFVDAATETERVCSAVSSIRNSCPEILISVDTYKASVAKAALDCGADIINDISAMSFDDKMVDVLKSCGAPVVLMHTRGNPREMQKNTSYEDPVREICGYLAGRADFAVKNGIAPEKIILDPGIGFAKLLNHNLALLRGLDYFMDLGYPVLVGASRKTFIGLLLSGTDKPVPPEERLEGTLAVTAFLVSKGVHIVRVHDIPENAATLKIAEALWR
jgi:dihydropteroate synthase